MTPQLPPERRHWAPVPVAYWTAHYRTSELDRLVLLLQRDYPRNHYRLAHGVLEIYVEDSDDDDTNGRPQGTEANGA